MALPHDLGILPLLMQLPFLFHSVLVEVVSTPPPPFSEQPLSLSVRSRFATLFPEHPLLFSVATPADKHLAGPPNGHNPTHFQTHARAHTHAHAGVNADASTIPQGAPSTPAVFLALAAKAASSRASDGNSRIRTITNNGAASKEESQSPGLRRGWL